VVTKNVARVRPDHHEFLDRHEFLDQCEQGVAPVRRAVIGLGTMAAVTSAQPGIFALGTTDHSYLEFDLLDPNVSRAAARAALTGAVGAVEELSTTGGVNVVIGVRPSLWVEIADPHDVPKDVEDWTEDLVGPDGFRMPATPRDLWLWLSAGSRTAVFDAGRLAIERLHGIAAVRQETNGWLYQHDRDLTGFIDGTENPSLVEAPAVVAVPDGESGAGSSVVLHQLWRHDTARWDAEPVVVQERAMGRTKADSIEFPDAQMPPDAHVARTTLEIDGEEKDIFRRNVAYGSIGDHGTVFVGFSLEQWRLAEMLRRMAGVPDGIRCALTRYVTPLTGAYYVVPSVGALAAFAPPED
jgi:porphyrinogen peroxidase